MMHEHQGNLLHGERGIIVHGGNAQRVMGAGIARVIKECGKPRGQATGGQALKLTATDGRPVMDGVDPSKCEIA